MRGSSLFPVFLLFLACMGCKAGYTDFVVGDWYRMDDYILVDQSELDKYQNKSEPWRKPPRPDDYYPLGLTFQSDGEVIFYPDSWKESGENWVYLGEVGKYLITKDSLWLAFPLDSLYSRKYSWKRNWKNSLILKGTKGTQRLNRFYPSTSDYQQIDSIRQFITIGMGIREEKAVSSSGNTEWRKSAYGEPVDEQFIGTITREEFDKLESRYNWAGFMELGDYSECCHGREIETVFYFEGKEIKRVVDYMRSTPMRYLWATNLMNSFVEKSASNKIDYQTDARPEP